MENDPASSIHVDQHIVWDDRENVVIDVGSEVEEYYRKGERIQPRRSPAVAAQRRTAASPVPGNLRPIRD